MIRRPPAIACAAAGALAVTVAAVAWRRSRTEWRTAACGCTFTLGIRPRLLVCAGHVHAREFIAEQLAGLR